MKEELEISGFTVSFPQQDIHILSDEKVINDSETGTGSTSKEEQDRI